MPPSGYAWWYFDGISDDQKYGITIIGFLGSVFSPYYFRARQGSSPPNPLDFAAFNIAVYGGGADRWAFTERRGASVRRDAVSLTIGKNRILADRPGEIQIDLDETSPKLRRPIKGTVHLRFAHAHRTIFFLDRNGRHRWQPIAPRATMEVHLSAPDLHFSGSAYHDMNWGDVPLESDFLDWSWSRHALSDRTVVFYDGRHANNETFSIGAGFDDNGSMLEMISKPNILRLPDTRLWRCPRPVRSDGRPRVIRTLENSPFYARSLLETEIFGQAAPTVHETLRLHKFVKPATQMMLPFRLRRET